MLPRESQTICSWRRLIFKKICTWLVKNGALCVLFFIEHLPVKVLWKWALLFNTVLNSCVTRRVVQRITLAWWCTWSTQKNSTLTPPQNLTRTCFSCLAINNLPCSLLGIKKFDYSRIIIMFRPLFEEEPALSPFLWTEGDLASVEIGETVGCVVELEKKSQMGLASPSGEFP